MCERNCDYCPIGLMPELKKRKDFLVNNGAKYPPGHHAWYITETVVVSGIFRSASFDLDYWMNEDPKKLEAECYFGMWPMGLVRWSES